MRSRPSSLQGNKSPKMRASVELIIDSESRYRVTDEDAFDRVSESLETKLRETEAKLRQLKERINQTTSANYADATFQALLKKKLNMLCSTQDVCAELEHKFTSLHKPLISGKIEEINNIPEQLKKEVKQHLKETRDEVAESVEKFNQLTLVKEKIVEQLQIAARQDWHNIQNEWNKLSEEQREQKRQDFINQYGSIVSFKVNQQNVLDINFDNGFGIHSGKKDSPQERTQRRTVQPLDEKWYEEQSLEQLVDLANQVWAEREEYRKASLYGQLFGNNPVDDSFKKIIAADPQLFKMESKSHLTLQPEPLTAYNQQLNAAKHELDERRRVKFDTINATRKERLRAQRIAADNLSRGLKTEILDVIDEIEQVKLQKAINELEEAAQKELNYISQHVVKVKKASEEIEPSILAIDRLILQLDIDLQKMQQWSEQINQWVSEGSVEQVTEKAGEMTLQIATVFENKRHLHELIQTLQQKLNQSIVSETKEAAGRCRMIRNEFGDSAGLHAAEQQLRVMRDSEQRIQRNIAAYNENTQKIDASYQTTKLFLEGLGAKITAATLIRQEKEDKKLKANEMLKRIRIALIAENNLRFWHDRVRFGGGKEYHTVTLPEGVKDILNKIPLNITEETDSQAILMEIKTIAARQALKTKPDNKLGAFNYIKYSIFHVRDPAVTKLYDLLSTLHQDDPRENNLDMLNEIKGLTLARQSEVEMLRVG